MPIKLFFLLVSLLSFGFSHANASDTMAKEVELFSKSLKYIKGFESKGDGFVVGVLYNKDEAESLREAKSFVVELTSSKIALKLGLKPVLIEVNDLGSDSKIHVAYIAAHLDNQYEKIYRHSREHKVFTISTNKHCVESRCCILSFDASSGLNIFLNQSNLRALGFGVNGAFKFMVKRV